MITGLKPNQLFIFGSNLLGNHAGGAALQAKEQFGAQKGVALGLTGQCYAFPTVSEEMTPLSVEEIRGYVDVLYAVAHQHPDKEFLLTKVGCGIAGHSEDKIAPLFKYAPSNITKPEDWR